MRLNPFNPGSIDVRRGGGGGFHGGGGGQLGCGAIVIALIGAVFFGIDPAQMLGGMQGAQPGAPVEAGAASEDAGAICDDNTYAMEACNALGSLNETWQPVFAEAGIGFRQPTLVFYRGGTGSGCGSASAAAGPFYCPADRGIYIDTGFYDQMAQELGAGGDFARYYVIAHEYGHHIQQLTGIADAIRSAQQQQPQQANQLQVLMELQADCYAGAWAGRNRAAIEPGDFEEGMRAAAAIGDDALMRGSGRAVSPENFTHGTSEQRMQALRLGLVTGDDTQCDRTVELR